MNNSSNDQKKNIFPLRVIFNYYLPSLRPHAWQIAVIFIAYGLGTLLSNVAAPLVFRNIIDTISSGDAHSLVLRADLWFWFWCFAGLMMFYQAGYRLGDHFISLVESRSMKHLADRAFADLHRHSYRFFSDSFSGSLVAKSKRFVGSFEALFDISVYSFWMTTVVVLGMIASLFFFAPAIAWVLIAWVIGYVWFSWRLMRKKTLRDEKMAKEDSKLTAHLSDILSNIITVKTFAKAKSETKSFAKTTTDWKQTRIDSQMFRNKILTYQTLSLGAIELIATALSLHLWSKGQISSGTVVLTQSYMVSLFGYMFQLNRSFGRFVQAIAEASEMIEIFETPTEVANKDGAKSLSFVSGELSFRDVDFDYADGSEVFRNFSMTVNSGEKVGLVGASGSGKSTLTKLLLRFLDPDRGTIAIDRLDLRDLKQEDLRRAIAYVSQDASLFHRSIRENIAYGKPTATEEEVVEAAKKAHAHEFISQLQKGYDTLVGERGVKLSGGERQRIALARAILKDAPVLILDEATSALDAVSEKLIQSALDELMREKTVLVIAHRLSTVRKMDRIIVLERGSIAEEGSHLALIDKQDGIYANLWKHQTDGFIE